MKKFLTIVLIILLIGLIGCKKKEVNNISVNSIITEIEKSFPIKNGIIENLKEQNIAEKYGISPSDIKEGVVYYNKDRNISDKILIAKVDDKPNIENVERAISAEIVGMTDSWKDNEIESKKVENHIFKVKDTYIMLCISENAKEIEAIFDKMLDKNSKS